MFAFHEWKLEQVGKQKRNLSRSKSNNKVNTHKHTKQSTSSTSAQNKQSKGCISPALKVRLHESAYRIISYSTAHLIMQSILYAKHKFLSGRLELAWGDWNGSSCWKWERIILTHTHKHLCVLQLFMHTSHIASIVQLQNARFCYKRLTCWWWW